MQKLLRVFFTMTLTCGLCFASLLSVIAGANPALASEAKVQAQLDKVAATLVQHAAQNLLPKPTKKAVNQENGQFVARYAAIDTANIATELMKGQKGSYVGTIKYTEEYFVCRGASKAEAVKAPCSLERTRKMTEIIAYSKGKWLYH